MTAHTHDTDIFAGFVEMVVTNIKSPRDNSKTKIEHIYTGPQDTEVVEGMMECDSEVCYSVMTFYIIMHQT